MPHKEVRREVRVTGSTISQYKDTEGKLVTSTVPASAIWRTTTYARGKSTSEYEFDDGAGSLGSVFAVVNSRDDGQIADSARGVASTLAAEISLSKTGNKHQQVVVGLAKNFSKDWQKLNLKADPLAVVQATFDGDEEQPY